MDLRPDARGHSIAQRDPVQVGGDSRTTPRSGAADRHRFRVKYALRSVEDALAMLEPIPAEGIEVDALERVRDDLTVVLRAAEADCR